MEESNCFLIALVSRNENRLQRLLIQSQVVLLQAVRETPRVDVADPVKQIRLSAAGQRNLVVRITVVLAPENDLAAVVVGILDLAPSAHGIGMLLKKKFKLAILNPLLISIVITIAFLALTGISYEKYDEGAKYLNYLLTPATVCLAIPLYEQLELLKHNWRAVLLGILSVMYLFAFELALAKETISTAECKRLVSALTKMPEAVQYVIDNCEDTCKFVNINVSEFQSLKMEAVPVVADAKEALPRLEKLLEGYQTAYKDEVKVAKEKWIDELNRLDHITFSDKKSWKPEINDANADSAKRFAQDVNAQLTQTSALGAINAMMSEGDVAIGAAGSLPGDMQRMWRPTGIDTYNMEYGYSTMGYEVAGALGVKLAIGDKHEVYSFCGDGSFNMLHGELITACQEHKKINICLFDNASFGCINNLQVGHGNVTLCTELRYRNKDGLFGNFMNIDYAKVAEAYGCKSYTVRTMEELVAAFEDAKKVKNIPVLFDIKVLPKTMTDGYSSWWRVGDTEVSERKENLAAYADLQAHLKEVRKY